MRLWRCISVRCTSYNIWTRLGGDQWLARQKAKVLNLRSNLIQLSLEGCDNTMEGVMEKKTIMIKPENKGKFTQYCKDHGHKSVTSECINEGLASKSAHVNKMAQFAKNARG